MRKMYIVKVAKEPLAHLVPLTYSSGFYVYQQRRDSNQEFLLTAHVI